MDDPFSVEATLSVSLQKRFFFKLSIWPLSSNIKLEGLSFLYSHSFMKKRSWLFDYFYAIWVNFLKTCEMSWTCYNLTSFPILMLKNINTNFHRRKCIPALCPFEIHLFARQTRLDVSLYCQQRRTHRSTKMLSSQCDKYG